jgi:hypothetical protein
LATIIRLSWEGLQRQTLWLITNIYKLRPLKVIYHWSLVGGSTRDPLFFHQLSNIWPLSHSNYQYLQAKLGTNSSSGDKCQTRTKHSNLQQKSFIIYVPANIKLPLGIESVIKSFTLVISFTSTLTTSICWMKHLPRNLTKPLKLWTIS